MVPNIGAFIAWGLITALFISTGWCPNETLAQLVDPMSKYLLPLLIGYTGGKVVGDQRGGVIGAVTVLNSAMETGVGFFVDHGLLPLASIFIEPAKVLFLNNAINHGILSPMGIQQVKEIGKSVYLLLESNPGPGLGVLLAYCVAGKGSAKSSAPGAVIIHFLGGIHEIYFPYILMNPLLLLAVIAGGASGIFTFNLFQVGLTGTASPGSIISILMMCERHCYLGLILGIVISAAVSFLIALFILRFAGKDTSLEEATAKKDDMKKASKGEKLVKKDTLKIAFACDAGMGSSAMGATVLKKKIAQANLQGIEVSHTPVSSIPADVDIVVTHQELGERAAHSNPKAKLVLITNFLAAPEYDLLLEELKDLYAR